MAATIRFHLDESVSGALATALRQRHIDVTTPADAGLLGAADEKHLEFARSEQRVLVTHDDDFLRLHQQGISHCGIAYCHQQKRSLAKILNTLVLMVHCLGPADMQDKVEYL